MSHLRSTQAYLTAYAAKDLPSIDLLLADSVVLQDWNLRVQGRDAVLHETARNFEAAHQIQIQIKTLIETDQCVMAELDILIDATLRLQVVDVLQFDTNGKIHSIRAYKG